MRTTFDIFKFKNMNFHIGSIADCEGHKLEVKTMFDSSDLAVKGNFVRLSGIVEL